MADSVERLKELLFDSEARQIGDLSRRLDQVFDRAGTAERFETSVAGVIDGALRKAEVERHDQLSDAIAPLVVRTVRTELRNSRDDLVEALYPMTGRMVKAYIASAMKDLANDINRRLEANPLMLRVRSLATGRSVAELAMAEGQRLVVEELYLIRRGTGALLGRWPEQAGTERPDRDHVMSGILAAINEFSNEALDDEGMSLRKIDLGERQIFLRASPLYLLAAKCSGTASQPIEQILDEAFLAAIERLSRMPDAGGAPPGRIEQTRLLPDLSNELGNRIDQKQTELSSYTGIRPLKLLAWIVGVPLLAWLVWSIYADFRTERARVAAAGALSSIAELKGYPVNLAVEHMGRKITVSGLAPTATTHDETMTRLSAAVPGASIIDQLSVLPSGLAEVEPKIASVRQKVQDLEPEVAGAREGVAGLKPQIETVRTAVADLEANIRQAELRRVVARASGQLQVLREELPRLAHVAEGDAAAAAVRRASDAMSGVATDLEKIRTGLEGAQTADPQDSQKPSLDGLAGRVREASGSLVALMGASSGSVSNATRSAKSVDAVESAENLSVEIERLSAMVVAASHVMALKKSLPLTPRERLEQWTRANAVFFVNGTDYREPAQADRALDELAALMHESDAFVRVVGYTDEKGGQIRNTPLSQARAEKIQAALIERNISATRLVAVGRLDGNDISNVIGETSRNRRVEFEVGFEGEANP